MLIESFIINLIVLRRSIFFNYFKFIFELNQIAFYKLNKYSIASSQFYNKLKLMIKKHATSNA